MRHKAIPILAALLLVLFLSCTQRSREKEKEELQTLVAIKGMANVIVTQVNACLSLSRYYRTVHEYAEVTGDDLKTAAREMSRPTASQNRIQMKQNKGMIEAGIEEIKPPSERFRQAHSKLLELFDLYVMLHELTIDFPEDIDTHEKAVNALAIQIDKTQKELDRSIAFLEREKE